METKSGILSIFSFDVMTMHARMKDRSKIR